MTLPEEQAPWACSQRSNNLPSSRELNTYSVQKEAAHYACARTIGDYRDELTAFIAAGFKNGQADINELVGKACRKKAKCLERKESESAEMRVKKLEENLQRQHSE